MVLHMSAQQECDGLATAHIAEQPEDRVAIPEKVVNQEGQLRLRRSEQLRDLW